ncbi:MAG TPA: hypothetical protein VEK34_00855 [Methylocella sp.]|nr:hypothetical protein [Methylocella sp.]
MNTPTIDKPAKRKRSGIPVGTLLIFLVVFGGVGLIGMGIWGLSGSGSIQIKTNFPVAGEWQAQGRAWRIDFRPDKTIVSKTAASPTTPADAWVSEAGKYKIDYFGNLWVMLKDGKTYTASLVPIPGAPADLAPVSLNRLDFVDSETSAVVVFERTQPIKEVPAQPNPAQKPAS